MIPPRSPVGQRVPGFQCACISPSSSTVMFNQRIADTLISQTCLAYLLNFADMPSLDDNVTERFSPANYAAQFWIRHATSNDATVPDSVLPLIMKLFQPDSFQFFNWVRVFNMDEPWNDLIPLERRSHFILCYRCSNVLADAGEDECILQVNIGAFVCPPLVFGEPSGLLSRADPTVFENARAGIPVTKQRRFDVYPDVSKDLD